LRGLYIIQVIEVAWVTFVLLFGIVLHLKCCRLSFDFGEESKVFQRNQTLKRRTVA
jgi:hypothetical protein